MQVINQLSKLNCFKSAVGKIIIKNFIAHNVKVLCAVGDFGNRIFNLPQKPDSSTNVQLTTSAPIAQNTCYMKCRLIYDKAQLEH